MKFAIKQRKVWVNLLLALLGTPLAGTVGLILITLVGALDDAITKLQRGGRWWIILIVVFFLTFIYATYEPKVRRDHLRKKWVSALILYWQAKVAKEGRPQPSNKEIELMEGLLADRIKVLAWSDPDLWSRYYPKEKYSINVFDIVDGLMAREKELGGREAN
jgi:hypothetical protein